MSVAGVAESGEAYEVASVASVTLEVDVGGGEGVPRVPFVIWTSAGS